ncbi:MAG TPA: YkgJ family cysteine cluster protein [Pyrinomonadaceae bacterium]|nr:YkgJ family cysteine cluster protein [Pyrinomonadaceae bacterium]
MEGQTEEMHDRLRREVEGGLLYCHHRENANTTQALEVTAFAYAVIDLLIEKGLLSEEELNERKLEMGRRLVEKFNARGMNVAIQESQVSKYEFEGGAQIDCAARLHLCKAACCRLKFPLSKQDLEEGIVRWDLPRPYLIARREDGYCAHVEGGCGGRCTIYEHRPLPCRAYDCRQDARIWADFENGVVSPELEKLFQQ